MRNIILSGYLVYPFPDIDLFSVDWKIPKKHAYMDKNSIRAWAIIPYDVINIEKGSNIPFKRWFPIWISAKPRDFIEKIILVFIFIYSIIMPFIKRNERVKKLIVLLIISLLGIAFWFLNAPDFRFVHGFLITAFILTMLSMPKLKIFIKVYKIKIEKFITIAFSFYFIILITSTILPKNYNHIIEKIQTTVRLKFPKNFILPFGYEKLGENVIIKKIGDHEIINPLNEQCKNNYLCTPIMKEKI